MMTRTTSFLFVVLAMAAGCDSEVIGGGSGSGGGSGGAGGALPSTSSSTSDTTSSSSSADGGNNPGVTVSSVTVGQGGSGGGNTLGNCEQTGGTGSATSGGTTMCGSDFTCDGGAVSVECTDDGTTETCDCSLDGAFVGSCIDEDRSGCGFPQNCCHALLGGHAEPNPGPYGACNSTSGIATSSAGGGVAQCDSYLDCDGGSIEISCSQPDGGEPATCECLDGQGFLLGACTQSMIDCDYVTNCCYDIFN